MGIHHLCNSYTHIKVEAFDEDNNIIENQTLHIENYYKTVVFTLDKNTMLINGDKVEIDAPARKSGIYLYVPFDDVCKAFYGKGSTWNKETQTEIMVSGICQYPVLIQSISMLTVKRKVFPTQTI
ncbi:MAG: stalk domain-containing protein [Caldisericia bacterium]